MKLVKTLFTAVGLLAALPVMAADDENRIIETYGYAAKVPATGKARGEQVYVQWCAICHSDGPGMAGTQGLKMKYKGKLPAVLNQREDLQGPYIEYIVRNGIKSMPHFRKTEVSDADLKALSEYLVKNPPQQ